jgi:glycerol-3-phosphate dehydrogenase (NAD(P)+)
MAGAQMPHDGKDLPVLETRLRPPLPMALRISLLGRGAWGSTLERLWSAQGHELRSWSRRDGGSPQALLAGSDLVVVAVSMAAVDPLATSLAAHWPPQLPLLSCSKGIDLQGLCTASQLWRQRLPHAPLAVLSGPNLAQELAEGLPAASVVASHDPALAAQLQAELRTPNLRLYTNSDPIGTEAAGALKNVMALAAGISDGLGLGANARASLLCRGMAEIGVVLQALGGEMATLYGLAGLGDLLATATSSLSRNQRFGALLASGLGEVEALGRIGVTVEGPRTARAALALAERCGWRLPICEQVVQLLDGRIDAPGAVRALMERDLRPEQ